MSELMTEREVAARLKVRRDTVQRWRKAGRGPAYIEFDSGTIRYRVEDVEAHELARRVEPGKGKG